MKQARDLFATLGVKAEVMNRAKVSRTLKAHLSRHSGFSNAAKNQSNAYLCHNSKRALVDCSLGLSILPILLTGSNPRANKSIQMEEFLNV
jgi:hypothetical protein